MKIELTNSQADIQIIADQIKNLKLDPKPAYVTFDGQVEVYENDQWTLVVNWKSNNITIKEA